MQQNNTYFKADINRVELSMMPHGVYVCRILYEDECYVYKFIRQAFCYDLIKTEPIEIQTIKSRLKQLITMFF